jgi:hypothetical protein
MKISLTLLAAVLLLALRRRAGEPDLRLVDFTRTSANSFGRLCTLMRIQA